jgi:ATP-dependent RNA helicase RhlE
MTFETFGLNKNILSAIDNSGYHTPTPIQMAAIPATLSRRDVLAAAQTGTGKTAGFTLPVLQLLSQQSKQVQPKQARVLILAPTRELAAQVHESILTYGESAGLTSAVVFGGVNVSPQRRALASGVDILVATPGRLVDLYQQKALKLDAIEILILDEADRMLDMGFIHAIRKIVSLLPKQRQNLMFSATFSDPIRKLAKTICHDPIEIDVSPRNSAVEAIQQEVHHVSKDAKVDYLYNYLSKHADQALVFTRTKHGANKLAKQLSKSNIHAAAFHGNKSQSQRIKALDDFKNDRVQILVATDIAARGIDIEQLALVVNYELPHVPEDYIHRIGRTGRAGASGLAISLVSDEEKKQLKAIEQLLKSRIPVAKHAFLPTAAVAKTAAPEKARESGRHQFQAANENQNKPARRRPRRNRSRYGRSAKKQFAAGAGEKTNGSAMIAAPQAK